MLDELRKQIDEVDSQLIELLGKRLELARQVARVKKQYNLPIHDPKREELIQEKIRKLAQLHGLSATVMQEIFSQLLIYMKVEMEGVE